MYYLLISVSLNQDLSIVWPDDFNYSRVILLGTDKMFHFVLSNLQMAMVAFALGSSQAVSSSQAADVFLTKVAKISSRNNNGFNLPVSTSRST